MHVTIENIRNKIHRNERISIEEALWLTEQPIYQLGQLAFETNERINGNTVYYNRNIHIEPTNICINHCLFCSYRRIEGQEGSWAFAIDDMLEKAHHAVLQDPKLTEFHIVGGVHPNRGLSFYAELIHVLHNAFPHIHIKAFTAEELVQMCKIEGVEVEAGIELLQSKGLMSLPGGGAEIFDKTIRKKICPDKISGQKWLDVHRIAHQKGLPTNATMLYGHYDSMEHRLLHMDLLRQLQDETNGFNAFIPLKFKAKNNKLSHLGEANLLEDLKTFAIARIFLDNIRHLKAYWPMLGIDQTLLLLHFGADDIDGTIADSTKIYSMAGADKKPSLSAPGLEKFIRENQREPSERDSLYNPIPK
ncbi:MAG: CofH family radical SAM protein [Salinivirgaceae bacterium]|jgi:aminodeoxyfutalosine synthase|nr:CofH family radical SAM protein [Salinivirgaceae bacterium]